MTNTPFCLPFFSVFSQTKKDLTTVGLLFDKFGKLYVNK